MLAISRRLEELYGANFNSDVTRFGEEQLSLWVLDFTEEKFLPGSGALQGDALELLDAILNDPELEDGGFRRDFFDQERENQLRYVQSIINDKMSYAGLRAAQVMFAGEPYAFHEWGTEDELGQADRRDVFRIYREVLDDASREVYVVGDVDPDAFVEEWSGKVRESFRPMWDGSSGSGARVRATSGHPESVIEEREVQQAKLVMGFRLERNVLEELPTSVDRNLVLSIMNILLGGGMHSKLFKEVREKQSLAYYASSAVDRYIGAAFITCGIASQDFEKTRDLSVAQIDAIARGNFTDDEFDASVRAAIHRLRTVNDSAAEQIGFLMAGRRLGRILTPLECLEQVNAISR